MKEAKMLRWAVLFLLIVVNASANAQDIGKYFHPVKTNVSNTDKDGFIRRWRLLEPLDKPIRSNAGFTDTYLREVFSKQYFKGQMTAIPRDGQKMKAVHTEMELPSRSFRGPAPTDANGKPLEPKEVTKKETLKWHELESENYNVKLFRFGEAYGNRLYGVLYWAVTLIECDTYMEDVRLAVGSNSASIWWLNGEEVLLMSGDRRMVVDDCVSKRLTLKKGINVLRGSVVNGPGMSDFCVRFLDANGKPLNQLKIK